uniref:Reduced folate carrier family protein n=1 Tax=Rhabditophanes sp. KR3021 TaxID=114890 RepID=A0AC35TGI8_9BILA
MKKFPVGTILVILYGVLKEFRPTEPYLYDYQHDIINISDTILNQEIYPWWTYSYMVLLLPVLLLTDVLLYKCVLIIESLSYIAVWLLLIYGKSVLSQIMVEVAYGSATATEIAYFGYIYAFFGPDMYKKVTIGSRLALNGGRFLSYVLAQVIIQQEIGSYGFLNWCSLGSLFLAFIVSLSFSSISWQSLYQQSFQDGDSKEPKSYEEFAKIKMASFWIMSKGLYKNYNVIFWSIWWILSSCCQFQILNYIQVIWSVCKDYDTRGKNYNGLVEALAQILSILTIFGTNWIITKKKTLEITACFVVSLISCGTLISMSYVDSIFIMYSVYILYRVLFMAMITISQYEISISIHKSSLGFAFGINTFLALVLESILTFIVADGRVLGLAIREQFFVYGCYQLSVFFLMFALFICRCIFNKS